VIPLWLIRILPHIAVAFAVIGAVWWIDHKGYQRAKADMAVAQAKARSDLQTDIRASEGRIASKIGDIDTTLATKIDGIETTNTTIIRPTIEREIASDPRYVSASCAVSDSILRGLNAIRTGSACSRTADGGIECALSAAASGGG